ncbi:MAG: choice-of-anchor G family protein [Aeromicrobium sp.]
MKKLARSTLALGTATLIVTAGLSFSAQGADATKSYSTGRFLTGSIGGTNLDNLAQVRGVTAANPGNPGANTNPLDVTLLTAIPVTVPGGLDLNVADFLSPSNGSAGVVNQYAAASGTGTATGASGAVNNTGAVLAPGNGQFPAEAKISLAGGPLASVNNNLARVDLLLGALSSVTRVDAGTPARKYQIGDLSLDVEVPLLKTLVGSLGDSIDDLGAINNLTIPPSGTDICALVGGTVTITSATLLGTLSDLGLGALAPTIQGILDLAGLTSVNACSLPPGVGALLNNTQLNSLLEELVSVNITGLGGITTGLGTIVGGNGAALDLSSGVISIDLEAILANAKIDINNLPPNTDLLQYLTTGLIEDRIASVLRTAINGVIAKVADVKVTITVGGTPLPPAQLDPLIQPVTDILDDVTDQLTTALAPVDSLLADLAPDLAQLVKLTGNNQSTSKKPTLGTGTVKAGTVSTAAVGDYYRTSALKIDVLSNVATIDLAGSEAAVLTADAPPPTDAVAGDDSDGPTDSDSDNGDDGSRDDGDSGSDGDAAADANADAIADADAQADADVTTTLPSTGAPNLLPFWLLGIALLLFGAAVLVNERRRLGSI